jgi:hypothetical protein
MQIESNTSRSHHAVDNLSATSRSHHAADDLSATSRSRHAADAPPAFMAPASSAPAFMAPAYIGTNPAFIGTSCNNRNVSKFDVYNVTRSTTCDAVNG